MHEPGFGDPHPVIMERDADWARTILGSWPDKTGRGHAHAPGFGDPHPMIMINDGDRGRMDRMTDWARLAVAGREGWLGPPKNDSAVKAKRT